MTQPTVSVVIPVFNGERYLAEAIESALAQTLPPRRVIIVDDGSTDGSVAVARNCGAAVQIIEQPNGGAGAARNAALPFVDTGFLAFLDADDTWPRMKTENQFAAFAADPSLDMVFGQMLAFLAADAPPGVRSAAQLAPIAACLPGTMLVRRDAFLRAGSFATDVRLGEFIDWYARAERAGLRSFMLPEVVLHRRLHANNTGLRERDQRADYLAVVRRAMDARRAANGGAA
jgi:glycosyltransferase involved in cell wall biosynthesis